MTFKLSKEERVLAVENLSSEHDNNFQSLSYEHKKVLLEKAILSHREQWEMIAELQAALEEQLKLMESESEERE